MACRLCNDQNYKEIDQEQCNGQNFTIVKCDSCGLVYIVEAYAPISPDYVNVKHVSEKDIWLQGEHKRAAFGAAIELVHRHRPEWKYEKPILLDVGCGTGGFLNLASKYFECFGFDASMAQIKYAQKQNPTVRVAYSISEYLNTDIKVATGFDLITLWDVLEHIREPVQFINELVTSLKPKGMVYIAVPNAVPMLLKNQFSRFGYPHNWMPHEHVNYFSPTTLRTLIEKVDLNVIQIGAVMAYPRKLSIFELVRRAVFSATQYYPTLSPQIFVLAQAK